MVDCVYFEMKGDLIRKVPYCCFIKEEIEKEMCLTCRRYKPKNPSKR